MFDELLAHTFSTVGIREGDATTQTFASIVSSNYFDTLGVGLAAGRAFTADEERPGPGAPVAIASYAVWRRRDLSIPAFVGSTIRVERRATFTVVGVAPRGFAGTMALVSPQWWFPLGSYDAIVNEMFKQRATGLTDRGNYALNLAGALKPGSRRRRRRRALDGVARQLERHYPATDKDRRSSVGAAAAAGRQLAPANRRSAGDDCRRC